MTTGKLIASGGVLAGLGVGWYMLYRMLVDDAPGKSESAPVPDKQPDTTPTATTKSSGSCGYKKVDAIMSQLRASAEEYGHPLGLAVGWVAKESGGKLEDKTSLDERGYFQLMPDESKSIGVDHQRLSTDSDYSIDAGGKLIKRYAAAVDKLGVDAAPRGTSYYWRLVKLIHTVGGGDTKTLVKAAQAANQAGSWDALEAFALSGAAKTKHSPAKWFPLIAAIYKIGRPFGFGSEAALVAGLPVDGLHLLGAEGLLE